MVRVFGSPVLHRQGIQLVDDPRLFATICSILYFYTEWPKGQPRPRLPRCGTCWQEVTKHG